ncbi:MAG: hypothetical protein QGF72_00200 [Candidatus Poseidoniaceae archaeon]|jgi:response regulator of citrate/malate metabolism|nr:hypothetical protein [Candidatus Poseidoniaceae archaeon]
MKVLAFEDSFDVQSLLVSGGVDITKIEFKQLWNTENWLEEISRFDPDTLLLDHFIPPTKGLEVLQLLNVEVANNGFKRPATIIGMSSSSMANQRMLKFGAEHGILKMKLPELEIWPRTGEHPNVTPL